MVINMADPIDDMLKDGEETPSASQAKNKLDVHSGNPIEGEEGLTPEEVEFSKLSGSAQDRFRKVIADKKRISEEAEYWKSQAEKGGKTSETPGLTTEAQQGIATLRKVGFSTKEDVRQEVNEGLATLRYNMELDRLETKYSGDDGRPKFTREEYEEYLTSHPAYKNYYPEDVYSKMFSEELFDWSVKHRVEPTVKQKTSPLRPVRTATQEEELTPESIEEHLKQPGGQQWYDEHLKEINATLEQSAKEQ